MTSSLLRIGTRKSPLAMWQAEFVKAELQKAHKDLEVELVPIMTKGDKILDVALSKVGGKGLFVKELEVALLEERVDICVHSTKDMPAELPGGLGLVAFPKRADPRDALVMGGKGGLAALPYGAKVGTSSLRRAAQLLHARPDLEIVSVRGNIQTRMKKVKELGLSCVVLAAAGIERMGDDDKIGHIFAPEEMLPAAAQGILSIEARLNDERVRKLIAVLDHAETRARVLCERAFLRTLGGGCQVPIAAYATLKEGTLFLRGLCATPKGDVLVRASGEAPVADAVALGESLGQRVLQNGGRKILAQLSIDIESSDQSLSGTEVIVARDDAPDDAMSLALFAQGADVVPLRLMQLSKPTDETALLRSASELGQYDAVAFTSSAGVEHFFAALKKLGLDLRTAKAGVVFAAVGQSTAQALEDAGVNDVVKGEGGGADLALALHAACDLSTAKKVLFPRAQEGREEFAVEAEKLGADVNTVAAYHHLPAPNAAQIKAVLDETSSQKRILVLTSPRRVSVLHEACQSLPKGLQCVAIGETTAKAIKETFDVTPLVAKTPSAAGVIHAIRGA